jgi:predicted dehydrogenase
MKPVGVGIIGASPSGGWAAATHVPALQMTADSEENSCALQS